jgi:hypothetical protein
MNVNHLQVYDHSVSSWVHGFSKPSAAILSSFYSFFIFQKSPALAFFPAAFIPMFFILHMTNFYFHSLLSSICIVPQSPEYFFIPLFSKRWSRAQI